MPFPSTHAPSSTLARVHASSPVASAPSRRPAVPPASSAFSPSPSPSSRLYPSRRLQTARTISFVLSPPPPPHVIDRALVVAEVAIVVMAPSRERRNRPLPRPRLSVLSRSRARVTDDERSNATNVFDLARVRPRARPRASARDARSTTFVEAARISRHFRGCVVCTGGTHES